jgi:CRP/FNR family transcriptional regulator, cyclic AMP receptor protein
MKEIKLDLQYLEEKLHNTKFFKHIEKEDQTKFIKLSTIFEYENDEIIIAEGDKSPYFFIILSGIVNVNLNQKDKSIYITTIGEGEIIGEAAIFVNFERTANIIAYNKVQILRIDRNSFISFIKENPASGIKLLMIIIHTLLSKLHLANHELAFERTTHVEQDAVDSFIEEYFNKS